MMEFEKIKKKFALNNSYFKNRTSKMPSNPFECLDYYKQHGELPYINGETTDNWFYECFVEYQKRNGVNNSQFFTLPNTVKRMVDILSLYANKDEMVLDACCGFGQITKELIKEGYTQINAFDNDKELLNVCYELCDGVKDYKYDFTDEEKPFPFKFKYIISNPPYEVKELTKFLEFVNETLYEGGKVVLLIPSGFLDKQRPADLVKTLNNFYIERREDMKEKFERTGCNAEIVVLSK